MCSYVSTFAPYGYWKVVKAAAGVLTVPDGQDSGMVDNNGFLTLKKEVLGGTLKSTLILLESGLDLLRRRGYQSVGSSGSTNNRVRPKCVLDGSVEVSIRYSKFNTLLESCLSDALS